MEERASSNIVLAFPDPLVITQSNNSNYFESILNLTNLTDDYIVFKIYNNKRELYSAKPSTSFIPPKETAKVAIKRFKKVEEVSQVAKDKFLLIFYTINKVINDNEEAKEAIKLKLYNENSKQETVISIILKNQEDDIESSTYTYNESVLENIGDDYSKGIKAYSDLNENLRKQSNSINQKIKELENALGMIKDQKKLKEEKEKAMQDNRSKNKSNDNNFSKIILISLILFGLLIGANIANAYNKFFYPKVINDEVLMFKNNENATTENKNIITNLNENKNNSEINDNKKENVEDKIKEDKKMNDSFFCKSLFLYICLFVIFL
jgi:hypothetical protein